MEYLAGIRPPLLWFELKAPTPTTEDPNNADTSSKATQKPNSLPPGWRVRKARFCYSCRKTALGTFWMKAVG